MRYFTFTAASSGAAYHKRAEGQFIRYMEATSGIDDPMITITTDGGDSIDLLPGQSARLGHVVREWHIVNTDRVAAIIGVLAVGDYSDAIEDNRIAGEVSVISGELSRTNGGVAYWSNSYCANLAANYSHSQFLNPTGSGLECVITGLRIQADGVSSSVSIREYDTALATFSGYPTNKYIGGTVSTMQLRTATNGSALGTAVASARCLGQSVFIPLVEPIILAPGKGILAVPGGVDTPVSLGVQHWERVAA